MLLLIALAVALPGCPPAPPPAPPAPPPAGEAVTNQQKAAYPEAAAGTFVSLADFEGPGADFQAGSFTVVGGEGGRCALTHAAARTGRGALEAVLPPGGALRFAPADFDLRPYTLLTLALRVEEPRTDLYLAFGGEANAAAGPFELAIGWNTVEIDVAKVSAPLSPLAVNLEFRQAQSPVTLLLDDVLAIDNRRLITPAPEGLTLEKVGLDYVIDYPRRSHPLRLGRDRDGLWRLGAEQPVLQIAPAGKGLAAGDAESIEVMGPPRHGRVELLEANPLRVRLASTWYFPAGPASPSAAAGRQIRWEHTFYGDGRWVAHLRYNNSGGAATSAMRLSMPQDVAWGAGRSGRVLLDPEFYMPVRRLSFQAALLDEDRDLMLRNYNAAVPLRIALAAAAASAEGDLDHDGFDESEGCYYLQAVGGRCRFAVAPRPGGVVRPIFRIAGPWKAPPAVTCDGQRIRTVVTLADGSILFGLPGRIDKVTAVEIVGEPQ